MEKDSNDIRHFSADDIRRYHAGEMSPHEMHAIEKAALEDAFLSDAIDGYAHTTTAIKDLEEIKNRLLTKETNKKIISIPAGKKSIYAPLKVAALALLLAGAGWAVYQFSLPDKNNIAKNKTELKETGTVQSTPALTYDSFNNNADVVVKEKKKIFPGKKESEKEKAEQSPETSIQKSENIKDQTTDVASMTNKKFTSSEINNRTEGARLSAANLADSATVFRGRIVNTEDRPVPYATINITDNRKNILTDAQGNFTIVTPDTILRASVNAAGYLTNKLNLNNPLENYKVILQPSEQSLEEALVTDVSRQRRKEIAENSATNNKGEVVPLDGFDEYNKYLLNNIKRYRDNNKKTVEGEVVLLFNVDDKGVPVNITVDKSLCPACDIEATRILKEGPKWQKKQNKKGRLVIIF